MYYKIIGLTSGQTLIGMVDEEFLDDEDVIEIPVWMPYRINNVRFQDETTGKIAEEIVMTAAGAIYGDQIVNIRVQNIETIGDPSEKMANYYEKLTDDEVKAVGETLEVELESDDHDSLFDSVSTRAVQ